MPRKGGQQSVLSFARPAPSPFSAALLDGLFRFACLCGPGAWELAGDHDAWAGAPMAQSGALCDPLAFRIDGTESPRVGDTWTILLTCDGDVATGAMRIAFDPPDFVRWDGEIQATFLEAGTATLLGQGGTVRTTREVTVEPCGSLGSGAAPLRRRRG